MRAAPLAALLVLLLAAPAAAAPVAHTTRSVGCGTSVGQPWLLPCPTLATAIAAELSCAASGACRLTISAQPSGETPRAVAQLAVQASLDDRPGDRGALRFCSISELGSSASCAGTLGVVVDLAVGACRALFVNGRLHEDAVVEAWTATRVHLCRAPSGGSVALSDA